MEWMSRDQLNTTLEELRAYAGAVRFEWEHDPLNVPSWVTKFETLDHFASQGFYPDSWNSEI